MAKKYQWHRVMPNKGEWHFYGTFDSWRLAQSEVSCG